MFLKLAWRNIWRNKWRTFITIAAILFAVALACIMRSMQLGSYSRMVDNVVKNFSGYVQIHQAGYWDEPIIDNSFFYSDSLKVFEENLPDDIILIPRLESLAFASHEKYSKGVLVLGIDPVKEEFLTDLSNRIIEGEHLLPDDKQVLIASGLAEYLHLNLDDSLVIISSGYHGSNAAGKYPIKGIVKFGSPDLNKQLVFLPLKESQWFYDAESRLSSLVVILESHKDVKKTMNLLNAKLDLNDYEVLAWQTMMPELVQLIEFDSSGGIIILVILYMIITFGIFGTIVMMASERRFEFGVLISIGMKRFQLMRVVWQEIIILGFLGVLAGMALAFPLILWLHINPIEFKGQMAEVYEKWGIEPIIPLSIEPSLFLFQALTVFLLTTGVALYPMIMIYKLKPVKAMRE